MVWRSRGRLVKVTKASRAHGTLTVRALDNGDEWNLPYFANDATSAADLLDYYLADQVTDPFTDDPIQDTRK